MADVLELVKAVKKVSVNAVNASKPVEVCFGKVMGVSPLKVLVDQKLVLGGAQLVLCRGVCNFSTVVGGKLVDVLNALKVGEAVVMLRMQGGQRYLILDRIGNG